MFPLFYISIENYNNFKGDDMVDAKQRIRYFMEQQNWSEYRLALESGLSQSTVANIFNRNTTPSLDTLQAICSGLGITMSQFFA